MRLKNIIKVFPPSSDKYNIGGYMNLGQIIFSQINPQDQMCWGVTAKKWFNENSFTDKAHLGGVIFKVSGLLHKGHVMIRLMPSDTYRVEIGRLNKGVFVAKKVLSDIYCEDLTLTLDSLVEGYHQNPEKTKEAYLKESYKI